MGTVDHDSTNTAVGKYLGLYFTELRLRLEHQAVPGYVEDPWVAKTMACGKSVDLLVTSYRACVNRSFREITPFSDDPSNVVADAVVARCSVVPSTYVVRNFSLCFASIPEAENMMSRITNDLKSQTLGQVVSFRTQLKRIQDDRKAHAPASNTPVDHGI
jgi:hypothetical protein